MASADGSLPASAEPGRATVEPTLGSLVVRGTLWTIGAFAAAQVLRLCGTVTMTQLLPQSAFGLAALVSVLLSGLQMFSDFGMGASIVQNKRGAEAPFVNTAWTIGVVRGVLLWLIACALAAPFAAWNGHASLAWLVPVAGLTALIGGLASTKRYTQNRQLRMGRLSLLELASQFVTLLVTVVWALAYPTVWALVVGWLAGGVLRTVLTHVALPGIRNRIAWERESAKAMVRFGKWVFASTVLTFFVGQSDRLIFARMIPMALLGVYSIALSLALLPTTVLGSLAPAVIFPLFGRILRDGGDFGSAFRRVRRPLMLTAGWMVSGFVAGGPTIITILLPPSYAPGGWMAQALAAGSWFSALEMSYGMAMLAHGKAHLVAVASAGKLLGMVILIPTGYALGGFQGAVFGYAGSEILRYAASAIGAATFGIRGWRQDGLLTLLVGASSLGVWWVAAQCASRGMHVWAIAGVVFVLVSLPWALAGMSELRKMAAWLGRARQGRAIVIGTTSP